LAAAGGLADEPFATLAIVKLHLHLHSRSRLPRAAFTMVEILLAMGIFSMVLIAIYACWSTIMRGTRLGLGSAAEVQRTRVALHALEESLGSAVMYADNPQYYSFFADTTADFAYLSFVARLPESFPGSGLFPGQPVRRVTFQVDGKKNLQLSQSSLLDISEQPYTITLAPQVGVFAIEFYNVRRNEWIPEWISTNSLPTMVRAALNFGDKKTGREGLTIRSIPVTAMAIARIGGGNPQQPQQPGAPRRVGPGMRGGQQSGVTGSGSDGGVAVIGGGEGAGGIGGIGGAEDPYTGPVWNSRFDPSRYPTRGTRTDRNSIFPPQLSF